MKKQSSKLYSAVIKTMTERAFLREIGMQADEMKSLLEEFNISDALLHVSGDKLKEGRFDSKLALTIFEKCLDKVSDTPEEGWLLNTYEYVRSRIFPDKKASKNTGSFSRGRLLFLQFLRGLYSFERENTDFNPTVDILLPEPSELVDGGYRREYKRFDKLVKNLYIYEFMRIGVDITPFNTLGHIGGVHYVAMHVARQLYALGVPVDLGLVSGAAAGHDIGKYGCKKSEERRIPYLHYYYTNSCFERFKMPMTGYIAANHSTWDLEIENLSAESLILIYSDFRVKSTKNSKGGETVHFYTLKESFGVILNKLDNVDSEKEQRYRKVYNKLKDFEDYMVSLGVITELPDKANPFPKIPDKPQKSDAVLLNGDKVVRVFKNAAIEHNIGLMKSFYREDEFGDLLETARSEKQWRNLRTYISIFGEYSIYMTEKQKLMTLRFLYELLAHRESDIRNQAGDVMGKIIAGINGNFNKELPEGVNLPESKVTALLLWEKYSSDILIPDFKLTDQHKKWIGNSLKNVFRGLLDSCSENERTGYIRVFMKWLTKGNLSYRSKEALLRAILMMEPEYCATEWKTVIEQFTDEIIACDSADLKTAAIRAKYHIYEKALENEKSYIAELKKSMGIDASSDLSEETMAEMYLDNLKARTPWSIKVANITLMLGYLKEHPASGQELHVATHLANLIKVSETVTVRRAAGEGLVSIIESMPSEQRNEIAVELGKGLEIADYQFSKYIPEYLGTIMLCLPPRELDELIADLAKFLEGGSGRVAATVMHTFGIVLENYGAYKDRFAVYEPYEKTLERKTKLINITMRGFAHYDNVISQEALWSVGTHIFGSKALPLDEKYEIFSGYGKKILSIYENIEEDTLDFLNNAAVLNHIYRFICEYELEKSSFDMPIMEKIAFFPGTFDPFSLSHKEIAAEIRDMGYEVYLALDEFSWSKKTQPRLQRRQILSMTVADQQDIYIFPDDIPVNIANPDDLTRLKNIFAGRELYFVAGSDVIKNASCYRAAPRENSIHSINHIIFKRASDEVINDAATGTSERYPITGAIIHLSLAEHFEDISSTRIRENIDLGRDISNMIDSVAQNYIYNKGLYLREPAYKDVLQAKDVTIDCSESHDKSEVKISVMDGSRNGETVAFATAGRITSIHLLDVFKEQEIAAYIRKRASGDIAIIKDFYASENTSISCIGQILIVELLSYLISNDYAYVLYYPKNTDSLKVDALDIIKKQGFINISAEGHEPIYAVDTKDPAVLFRNVETMIKSPLNKNRRVIKAVNQAHDRLLESLQRIYPGKALLSYNAEVTHYKMINLIARLNGVSAVKTVEKKYGPYMAVPFGKVLEGVVVPNTVTKALHTEKYFSPDVTSFTIEESEHYSPLTNQVRTIKSFKRPVILVDDLLHKGYRMNKLDPLLKESNIEVVDTVVGVLTGRGRDLMTIKERRVDGAYFLPNLNFWLDEAACYPFIGGDSMKDEKEHVSGKNDIPSLNLILPYTIPTFLGDISGRNLYDYSMICLENAKEILLTLEEEYQNRFERKLTLGRLGEAISMPKRPDLGAELTYDENIAPSVYVQKDIEKLIRLRRMFK